MNYQFSFAALATDLLPKRSEDTMRVLTDFFFLFLFFVLLAVWLVGWTAFHVAGGAIHLLLIVAVISLIIHFFRGRSVA
jgi:uncharacterized membrane protein (DUF485 family)